MNLKIQLQYLKKLAISWVLLLIIYQILRFAFYMYNKQHFPNVTSSSYLYMMLGSLKFDIAALIYINLLFILGLLIPFNFRSKLIYQTALTYIFIITNSIGILLNVIDIPYYTFTFHRTNANFFLEFKNDTHLVFAILEYIKSYWYVFLGFILVMYLFTKLAKIKYNLVSTKITTASYYIIHILIFFGVAFLCFGGLRGSFKFKTRPINVGYATEYVNNPTEVNIVLNTPFSIFFTWGIEQLPEKKYFNTIAEAASYFNPIQAYKTNTEKKLNVVVIVVESLSREFIGALNKNLKDYKSYTPFLDSLIAFSYTSTNAIANGRKSIQALPCVIASIPTMNESFVLTPYSSNNYMSVAHVLKKRNYSTSFYHGAHRGSMGFWAFMNTAGFDKYYGSEDFNNNAFYDGTWGIWDEEFMQYWASNLNKEKQPFLSCIFTVSSHHPYAIPDRYKNNFNKSKIGIQNNISYTDNALKLFFEKIKKETWFNNTLFVITADHCATENYHPMYLNELGNSSAPVIFYSANKNFKPSLLKRPIQQSDIYPSIVDYLGIKDTILAFGHSVFDSTNLDKRAVITCRKGLYQMVIDSLVLQYDGDKDKVIGLYNYTIDNGFYKNLAETKTNILSKNLPILKAYVQQYSYRMRNNKLVDK